MRAYGTLMLLVLLTHTALQAELLTPREIPGLRVWLTDAANNYDAATGIWTDISGNSNHTMPVGTVANTGITYVSPGLNMAASTIDTNDSAVLFDGVADDMLVIPSLNNGSGLGEFTIVTVYNAPLAATNGAVRPAGFGSLAVETPALGGAYNLATDGTIRLDNGRIDVSPHAHPAMSFVRISGMSVSQDSIMEWWDTGSGLQPTLADMGNGNAFTTATDHFYLGDLRVGATGLPANTPELTTIDQSFEVSQVLIYEGKLTDEQAACVNYHIQNVPEPASGGMLMVLGLWVGLRRRRSVTG